MSPTPFTYLVCNTVLATAIEIPELVQRSDEETQVTVEWDPSAVGSIDQNGLSATIEYGTISVPTPDRLIVRPAPTASAEATRQLLLGSGLRLLFHRRGNLVFHASAVDIDGVAVGFLGAAGAGKSTTAGAFAVAGYDVLADDVVVVANSSSPIIPRSVAGVKLDEAAAAAFGFEPIEPKSDDPPARRYHRTPTHSNRDDCPLGRWYLLTEGSSVSVTALEPGDAVFELMRYSYTEYKANDTDRDDITAHFHRCGALAESVGVRRLNRPARFDALSDVVAAVEEDLACGTIE